MGFVFLLLYLSVTLLRPGDIWPELNAYQIPMWTGLAGVVCSVRTLFSLEFPWCAWQVYLMGGFLGTIAISQVAQGWLGGAVAALSSILPGCLGCVLILLTVNSLRRLQVTMGTIVVLVLFLGIQAIAAFHWEYARELFVMVQSGGVQGTGGLERVRGLGTLNDPNDFAQALTAVLPFLWLTWSRGRVMRNLVLVLAPTAIAIYAIYLTHSRGAIIAVLAVVVLGARLRLQRFRNVIPALAGVLVLTAALALNVSGGRSMSSGEESALGRIESWSIGLSLIKRFPVFGAGYSNFTEHNYITAHNSFVLCCAELGLVGYFFWLGLLLITVMELRELTGMKTDNEESKLAGSIANSVLLSLTSFLVGAFFLSRTYSLLLYLLIGLAVALVNVLRRMGWQLRALSPRGFLWSTFAVEGGSIVLLYGFVRIQRLLVH